MKNLILLATVVNAKRPTETIQFDLYNQDIFEPSIEQSLISQAEQVEEIKLEFSSDSQPLPDWLTGTLYRNGPGKFEFGEAKFGHFFDPSALIQKLDIKDGSVSYRSKFIRSRNFLANEAVGKIWYPELGTGAEPDWITQDENGNPFTDEEIVSKI